MSSIFPINLKKKFRSTTVTKHDADADDEVEAEVEAERLPRRPVRKVRVSPGRKKIFGIGETDTDTDAVADAVAVVALVSNPLLLVLVNRNIWDLVHVGVSRDGKTKKVRYKKSL